MRTSITLLMLLLWLPTPLWATDINAGFVQGIWYDREPLFAGEPARIYVAIRNSTGAELTGTVTFLVNDRPLAQRTVSALNGRIIETWADWTPSYGEQRIRAELSRLELTAVGSTSEPVTVTAALADDVLFIDYDTDGDGIGNTEDTDDDGDGISDETELRNGTDPLVVTIPAATPTQSASTSSQPATEATPQNPVGLERYLAPSPAATALSTISEWAHDTRESIINYQETRAENPSTPTTTTETRDDNSATTTATTPNETPSSPAPPPADTSSFFAGALSFVSALIHGVTGAVLWVLTVILGHPAIIQFVLLVLMLLLILKGAQRLSRRPGPRS